MTNKNIPRFNTKKKIAVIGAGIGGLTAGIYAMKCGFETDLYEQHTIVGGECTGWDRKGYHIDNCIHWMIGTKQGTALNQLWHTVGALDAQTKIHKADQMYTSYLHGQKLSLWADIARTEQEMIALSPEDEKEIHKLMKFCRLAQKTEIPAEIPAELMGIKASLKMTVRMINTLKIFKEYKGMNIQDLMDKFKHPLIRCLISDFTPADSLANTFPMAYGNFASGDGGIPSGGSRAMAIRMKEKFESYGGNVFCKQRVEKILTKEERATGIQLENGEKIFYDYIIPACDTSVTFGTLLNKSYMEPLMVEMYKNRKAYPVYGTFQTAFAVDAKENILNSEQIWDCPKLVYTKGASDRVTLKSYSYEPQFAPKGKQIIQTLQGGNESLYHYWKQLYQDKNTYHAKKEELAWTMQKTIEKRLPAFKGKLMLLDTWTPMTYQRYCSAYKGFYQSFMISKDSSSRPYPSAYIQGLKNVILAGQWINPPGGLPGAAISGKFAVQRICRLEGMNDKI